MGKGKCRAKISEPFHRTIKPKWRLGNPRPTIQKTGMKTNKVVNIGIAAIWAVVFVCPLLLQYYYNVAENAQFDWHDLSRTYIFLSAFFLLFLLHHYLVIPLLYARKRYWMYALAVVVMLSGFALFTKNAPHDPHHRRPMKEHVNQRDCPDKKPDGFEKRHKHPEFRKPHRHPLLAPPDIARLIIALLMLGVNLGAEAMVKSQEQRRRLTELEQQHLKQELEYLKYQINPHFFMNTLNNIHVLIDIDQEKAKRSLVELSKLMRYTLYESNSRMVLLSQEIDFITQYLSLMKLRYSDKVEIVSQMPTVTNGIQIPPLLLVTFIENAFKHGVSYQQPSFIRIVLAVGDDNKTIHFECCNSRHLLKQSDDSGGIGLENVRKRLDLIYENGYKLNVEDDNPEQYRVTLELRS